MTDRDEMLTLDDAGLSALCRISFGYGTGPGGQKRNKTSTAVRVELPGTDFVATDCTERSQHRNRANALRKLRISVALHWRKHPAETPAAWPHTALENPGYPLLLAQLFDLLEETGFDHRAAAEKLGVSPTMVIRRLARDPAAWQLFAAEREKRNLPALRH